MMPYYSYVRAIVMHGYIEHTYIGLNKHAYEAFSESDSPYLCPHCMINKQAQEIDNLKQLVKTLTNDLVLIKNQSSAGENQGQNSESHDSGIAANQRHKNNPSRQQTTFNTSSSHLSTEIS